MGYNLPVNMKQLVFSLILAAAISGLALATTWFSEEITCPLCGTKNTFYSIRSYGTYIYQWPSRYQLIFWPKTDAFFLWSCKKCKLTTYMWDFEKIPEEKRDSIRAVLMDVSLSGEYKGYHGIPMPERLEIAEKVYRVLGRDEYFWCEFYRVKAYHLDLAGREGEAKAARLKALAIAEGMLARPENQGIAKELLAIAGAMRYFTGDSEGAIKDLKKAQGLTYAREGMTDEQIANTNDFFNALLADYIDKIERGEEIPRY